MADTQERTDHANFIVIARSGPTRGVVWSVNSAPLLMGRGPECDVVISDPLVSRRHCRLELRDGTLFLEDLGSRNTTLVNGRPTRQCRLREGDELGVGTARLTVASGAPDLRNPPNNEPTSTVRFYETDAQFFQAGRSDMVNNPAAHTVDTLANLLALSRDLWAVQSVDETAAHLENWLRRLFDPQGIWIATGSNEFNKLSPRATSVGLNDIETSQIADHVIRSLDGQEGVLSPLPGTATIEGPATVMVAPLVIGKHPVGAVAIVSQANAAYSSDQLQLLMAVANMAAPWFHSIERIETLNRENARLRQNRAVDDNLVGVSRSMSRLRSSIRKAAESDLNVLILGETGVGKELAAQMIWRLSDRNTGPFVPINCAAIPRDLFESELFGYVRGAFTGADQNRKGLIESADGGTLFLDEIGELSSENQARLLRVLERRSFRRVGGEEEIDVDFRLVAATNKDLVHAVDEGSFRRDLLYRINAVELSIPPLRDRPSDIPVLAQHFFEAARLHAKRPVRALSPEAVDALRLQRWPGNVRELRSVIERAVAFSNEELIRPEHLTMDSTDPGNGIQLTLAEVERRHIRAVLQSCGGRISETARILGIGRTTLYDKISRGDLEANVHESEEAY